MPTMKQTPPAPDMCQIAPMLRSLGAWASGEQGTHGYAACVHALILQPATHSQACSPSRFISERP